jgi:hypothetical protein
VLGEVSLAYDKEMLTISCSATLGDGLRMLSPMASRFPSLYSLTYVGFGAIAVATLAFESPESCRTSSGGSSSLDSTSCVGIRTIGFVTLCIGLPPSLRKARFGLVRLRKVRLR